MKTLKTLLAAGAAVLTSFGAFAEKTAKAVPQGDVLRFVYDETDYGTKGEEWLLRFGTLTIDLEEHARRAYAIAGNKFTGSSGGVKDWLKKNCPVLAAHYSTCQRYKRLAQDCHT